MLLLSGTRHSEQANESWLVAPASQDPDRFRPSPLPVALPSIRSVAMDLRRRLAVHCTIFIKPSGLAYRLISRYPSFAQSVFRHGRRYGDIVTWRFRKLT